MIGVDRVICLVVSALRGEQAMGVRFAGHRCSALFVHPGRLLWPRVFVVQSSPDDGESRCSAFKPARKLIWSKDSPLMRFGDGTLWWDRVEWLTRGQGLAAGWMFFR